MTARTLATGDTGPTRDGKKTYEDLNGGEGDAAMTPRYYSARLTKGGPIVGVKLFFGPPIVNGETLDRSHRLQCMVDLDPDSCFCWQLDANDAPVDVEGHVLRHVTPIHEAEYRFLTARARWADTHDPWHPSATPREAIAWNDMKPIF